MLSTKGGTVQMAPSALLIALKARRFDSNDVNPSERRPLGVFLSIRLLCWLGKLLQTEKIKTIRKAAYQQQ